VPWSVPFESSVSPGGRSLERASFQSSAPVAPPAVSITLYGVFTKPFASGYSVVGNNGVTTSVNCRAPKFVLSIGSAACTKKVYRPAVVGVPLRSPSDERLRPGGGVPSANDQTYDGKQHADSWRE